MMSVLDLPSRFEGDESGIRGSAESIRGDVVGEDGAVGRSILRECGDECHTIDPVERQVLVRGDIFPLNQMTMSQIEARSTDLKWAHLTSITRDFKVERFLIPPTYTWLDW